MITLRAHIKWFQNYLISWCVTSWAPHECNITSAPYDVIGHLRASQEFAGWLKLQVASIKSVL